jgi:hypothetical protein
MEILEMSEITKAELAQKAVFDAKSAWENAPFHVRKMGGVYVTPLLAALEALAIATIDNHEANHDKC